MDGPGGYCAKWSKSNREREITYDITYMWTLLINDTKELIYRIDSQTSKANLLLKWKHGGEDKLGAAD